MSPNRPISKNTPAKNLARSLRTARRNLRENREVSIYNSELKKTPNMVFLWIPKSSGSTLFEQLSVHYGMQKVLEPRRFLNLPNTGAITPGHVHWLSLLKSGLVSTDFHNNSYKFTIVRNPYDRVISLYNYLTMHKIFTGCIDVFLEEVLLRRPPIGLYNNIGLSQTNPQIDWVIDDNGELIVDDFFRIENLKALEDKIHDKFGTRINTDDKRNVSIRSIQIGDILRSPHRIEVVNEIYRRDFELFEYEKMSP